MISFPPLTGVTAAEMREGIIHAIPSTVHIYSAIVVGGSVTIVTVRDGSFDRGGRKGGKGERGLLYNTIREVKWKLKKT